MMFSVWKLSEYRERLNKKNDIENEWLKEIEKIYSREIQLYLDKAEGMKEFNSDIEKFLSGNLKILKEDVVYRLNNYFMPS